MLEGAQAAVAKAQTAVEEKEQAAKAATLQLTERKKAAPAGAPLPVLPENASEMTVAELQAELKTHGQDTSWDPTEGKTVLVERLQARSHVQE